MIVCICWARSSYNAVMAILAKSGMLGIAAC
jgi:hypothetical protein